MEAKIRRPKPELVALLARVERCEITPGQAAVEAGVDPATIVRWQQVRYGSRVDPRLLAGQRRSDDLGARVEKRKQNVSPAAPATRGGARDALQPVVSLENSIPDSGAKAREATLLAAVERLQQENDELKRLIGQLHLELARLRNDGG